MNSFPNYFNHVAHNFDGNHMKFETHQGLRFLQIGVYTGDASVSLLQKFSNLDDFILTDVKWFCYRYFMLKFIISSILFSFR